MRAMRAKIRKLETTVKAKSKELFTKYEEFKDEELQRFKKDQVDHHEAQGNEIVDILFVFMSNNAFKRIADKIRGSIKVDLVDLVDLLDLVDFFK